MTTPRAILFATVTALLAPPGAGAQALPPGFGPDPVLPAPDPTYSAVNSSRTVVRPSGQTPTAPAGFEVKAFATSLDHPRWPYVLPNGDVLVAEASTEGGGASADRITLLRDGNRDGVAEERTVLLSGLNRPFGMLARSGVLYVANTDAVMRYPFKVGQTRIEAAGEAIFHLPAGGYNNHWTRNLAASPDGRKLYVTVGSASNVGEHGIEEERNRAAIHEIDLDGGGDRILASGLRNPNGLDFEPESGLLWTAVNERDGIGADLVPDYITSVTDGGFYGWPYSYWGRNPDPRLQGQGQGLVARAIAPDYAVGAHTASLGLSFYRGEAFPEGWRNGAYVAQHGSWNRSEFAGYKVIYVPFEGGKPKGAPKDFLTGFVADPAKSEVYGRPTGIAQLADGSLLVTDDAGNAVWRVAAAK